MPTLHRPGVRVLLVLLLAASVLTGTGLQAEQIKPTVVGGTPAVAGEFPWMAAIAYQTDRVPFCGGALVAPQWVLTTGHCVAFDTPASLVVILGALVPTDEQTGQALAVSDIMLHPAYTSYPLTNDIALLRLATPADLTDAHVAPIALMSSAQESALAAPGTLATVAGWGARQPDGSSFADTLYRVDVPLWSAEACVQLGGGKPDITLCAGGETGVDTCTGDSGSPLVVAAQQPEAFLLLGLTGYSIGPLCGTTGIPGVYTRVAWYADWVAGFIGSTRPTPTPTPEPPARVCYLPLIQRTAAAPDD